MEPQNQSPMNDQPIMTPGNPVMPTPMASPAPTAIPSGIRPPHDDKKVGPIIATLVIVLILIIAALYLFAAKINQPAIPDDSTVSAGDLDGTVPPNSAVTASTTVQPVTGTSTDVHSLQNDLNGSTDGLNSQNF